MIMERGTQVDRGEPHKLLEVGSIPTRAINGRRKRYERIGQMMIRPLLLRQEQSAYDLARLFYAQYADLDFETDLKDYMRNGFVVTRPHLFGMIKPIIHEGERVWYVRIVIGDLLELISCLPCMLPKILYCRNNQCDKMVVVDAERLIELARKRAQRHGRNGN